MDDFVFDNCKNISYQLVLSNTLKIVLYLTIMIQIQNKLKYNHSNARNEMENMVRHFPVTLEMNIINTVANYHFQ
jgi:hypothetical protein